MVLQHQLNLVAPAVGQACKQPGVSLPKVAKTDQPQPGRQVGKNRFALVACKPVRTREPQGQTGRTLARHGMVTRVVGKCFRCAGGRSQDGGQRHAVVLIQPPSITERDNAAPPAFPCYLPAGGAGRFRHDASNYGHRPAFMHFGNDRASKFLHCFRDPSLGGQRRHAYCIAEAHHV
ncbi:MAG: hypothetical protein ABSG53_18310, partial [Thermoguttaceae bacterium]